MGPQDGDEGRFNDVERELDELRDQLRRASEHPFRRGETRSIRLLEERLREMQGRLVQSLQQNERLVGMLQETRQQVTLLRAMDDYASAERGQKAEKHGNTVPEFDTQLRGNFYDIFRGITLHGYYTSEIGFTQELKLQIIPGAQHGCEKIGPGLGDA